MARRLTLALACVLVASTILALIPSAFGRPARRVRITWNVGGNDRQTLEQRFRLSEPIEIDRRAWAYVPLDTSPSTLAAIVNSPAVVATDGIDRRALRMSSSGPLTERRGGWFPGHRQLPRLAKLTAYLLLAIAALIAVLPLGAAAPTRTALTRLRSDPRAAAGALRGALVRGIPLASPESAAAFRIVFVALVTLIVMRDPVDSSTIASITAGAVELRGLQSVVVPWLAGHQSLVDHLRDVLLASGALTIAGVVTRLSYAGFVAAFTAWACLFTTQTSHHTIAALHLTLIGLLAAPWSDAWSVDAIWMHRRGRGERADSRASRRYGFVFWLPGFVFGVAFLAAAWSKVQHGPDWILNGTVRYHFVTDLSQAWVKWGPWLTQNHIVAIALSAVAICLEASLIAASFTRSSAARLVLGAGAASLLTGFALFQGLFWRGWWVLLLSFLPWDRLQPGRGIATVRSSAAASQVAVIVVLLLQQIVISAAHAELPPFGSSYDMYSATYNSEDEYEASTNLVYQVLVRDSSGEHEVAGCTVDDRTAARLEREQSNSRGGARQAALSPCGVTSPDATAVVLRGDRRVYDWNAKRFWWRRGVDIIGPIRLEPTAP